MFAISIWAARRTVQFAAAQRLSSGRTSSPTLAGDGLLAASLRETTIAAAVCFHLVERDSCCRFSAGGFNHYAQSALVTPSAHCGNYWNSGIFRRYYRR